MRGREAGQVRSPIEAAFLVLTLALLARLLLPYTLPFVLALVMAVAVEPAVGWAERRWRLRRAAAVAVVLCLALFTLTGVFLLALVNLAAELSALADAMPMLADDAVRKWEGAFEWVQSIAHRLPEPVGSALLGQVERALESLGRAVWRALEALQSLSAFIWQLMIAGWATYFISCDGRRLWAAALSHLPERWRGRAGRFVAALAGGILGYLRVQLILASTTAVIAVCGLLAFRVPYAWLLGLLTGLFDLAPALGPSALFLPIAGFFAFSGDWSRALGLGAVLGILLVVRQGVEPRAFDRHMGLHPLTSLFSMYMGLRLLGLAGLWAGPLVAVAGKAFWRSAQKG